MKAHPQNPFADVWEQAQLEKDAGLFARAAEHAAQAAELAPNVEDRLWKRVFWAYYLQLGNGNQAGIDAMRQVQQEISSAGITHPKLAETAQQRLTEWGSQLARTGR